MSEWQKVTLEEIASPSRYAMVGGPFGSALGRKDYGEEGVPVVRGAQLGGPGLFSHDDLVYVSQEKADRHSGNLAFPGDVLVTQRGTVGQVGLIPMDAPFKRYLLSQSQMKLTVDPARAKARFVYYWLRSPEAQQAMVGSTISAGVPHINLATFKGLKLRLPPTAEQASIVRILGSIDDLIENNRRRVEVLEEMTRAMYREWFVRFRYPGHESVPLVDSPLGPIPDGWAASTCGDQLTILGGGTPSKKEDAYWDGGDVRWFTPSDLTKLGLRYAAKPELRITLEGLARSSARLFPEGSVLMTSRATLGVLAITTFEATTNQGFIVIPPDDRWSPGFIYEWLDCHAEDLASVATGAIFKEITKGAFKRVPFVVPAQEVLNAHRKVTEPLEEQIRLLEEQTRCLLSLRHLLLPRLVTGQIDVSHLGQDNLAEAAIA